MFRPRSLCALLWCVAASAVPAQDQTGNGKEAEALLAKMEQALLGKASPEVLKRRAKTTFVGRYDLVVGGQKELKLKGPIWIWYDGERAAKANDYAEWGMARACAGPDLVWEDHPAFGAAVKTGAEADVIRRCFGIVRYTGWRAMYQKAALSGTETIDGRAHHVLAMTPKAGKPDTWYLDQETLLPWRIEVDYSDTMGRAQFTFTDWRPVDGVMYAHHEKTVAGAATGTVVYERIEHGTEVDAAHFAPTERVKEMMAKGSAPQAGCRIDRVLPQLTAVIRTQVKQEEISKQLAVLLPEVMQYLTTSEVEVAGPPFTRYFGNKDGTFDMEAGIPVKKAIAGKGRVKPGELPGGKVAATWHVGPYRELATSYQRLQAWMAEQKLTGNGPMWEIYVTDPGLEQDPKKWRTHVLIPIE